MSSFLCECWGSSSDPHASRDRALWLEHLPSPYTGSFPTFVCLGGMVLPYSHGCFGLFVYHPSKCWHYIMCSPCPFFPLLTCVDVWAPRAYLVPSESRKGALDPLELTSVSHFINIGTLGLVEEQLLLLTARSSLQYPHWLFLIRVFWFWKGDIVTVEKVKKH